jgi:CubicO group peptidase (beta-lactamase class C family)
VLGWDTPTPPRSSAGAHISPEAVGHLGFTGTSVWIDWRRGLVVVLLTNRVAAGPDSHPAMKAYRPRFHDALLRALGG